MCQYWSSRIVQESSLRLGDATVAPILLSITDTVVAINESCTNFPRFHNAIIRDKCTNAK